MLGSRPAPPTPVSPLIFASKRFHDGSIRVFFPVMDDQAVGRARVQPTFENEGVEELCRIPVPAEGTRDVFVRPSADISPAREFRGQVPDALENTDRRVSRKPEPPLEA